MLPYVIILLYFILSLKSPMGSGQLNYWYLTVVLTSFEFGDYIVQFHDDV